MGWRTTLRFPSPPSAGHAHELLAQLQRVRPAHLSRLLARKLPRQVPRPGVLRQCGPLRVPLGAHGRERRAARAAQRDDDDAVPRAPGRRLHHAGLLGDQLLQLRGLRRHVHLRGGGGAGGRRARVAVALGVPLVDAHAVRHAVVLRRPRLRHNHGRHRGRGRGGVPRDARLSRCPRARAPGRPRRQRVEPHRRCGWRRATLADGLGAARSPAPGGGRPGRGRAPPHAAGVPGCGGGSIPPRRHLLQHLFVLRLRPAPPALGHAAGACVHPSRRRLEVPFARA